MRYRALKRWTAFLTAFLTVLCGVLVAGIGVNAAKIIDNGDYVYKLQEDGKSLSVIKYSGNSLYVKVPSRVEKYAVTAIESAAFMYNDTIKELEISDSIKEIKSNAFAECKSLKKLSVPSGVKEIGDSAFSGCTSLKTVIISDGTERIGSYCFAGCGHLAELSLPEKMEEIGEYAFFGCSSLEKIDMPKNFETLGSYALEGTKWMDTQKEEFVVVGDGILIKYNRENSTINVPDKIKVIGECAFSKNEKVKEITLPKTVTKIKKAAFADCTSLKKINLGDVAQMGVNAFRECTELENVVLSDKLDKISEGIFEGCKSIFEISIPASVKSIDRCAFKNCTSLDSVEFANGTEIIQEGAFEGCTSLRRLEFPETLKEVNTNMCTGCHSLTRVEFKSAVKIPSVTFSDCSHLSEAVFYKKPADMEVNAFNHCSEKFALYSSDKKWLEKYAEKSRYELKGVNQLALYNDKGVLPPEDDTEKNMFSGGHTALIIMILIADCGVVVFFAGYVLLSRKRGRKRSSRPVSRAEAVRDSRQPRRSQNAAAAKEKDTKK